ncbi:MAG: DNA replication and repair protein RecF [Candidatus Riflebacteria bacterium]|nr:DNA replication and repair protein RecF [Candidatus Riflebacteria bacterium]
MRLSRLSLAHFRNYAGLEFRPGPEVNLLIGANAQGKTNLLEAIALVARGRSARVRTRTDIVRHGQIHCRIDAEFEDGRGLPHSVGFGIDSSGARRISLDQQRLERTSQLYATLPCVFQESTDLDILTGPPATRRAFLDTLCLELAVSYLGVYLEYQKLLRSRNVLLVRHRHGAELGVIEVQLARVAARLVHDRRRAVSELERTIVELPHAGEEERMDLEYRLACGETVPAAATSTQELEAWYLQSWQTRLDEDLRLRTTTVGPHRDDLSIRLGGWPIKRVASRGQLKDVLLRLRLAEAATISQVREDPPIMLLDDAFSETDETRRRRMTCWLPRNTQIFLTGTDASLEKEFEGSECRRFRVRNGAVDAVS